MGTLASQRFPDELRGGRDSGHDLVYRDGYLYVTGQNDHCLMVLRVESERIRRLGGQWVHLPISGSDRELEVKIG